MNRLLWLFVFLFACGTTVDKGERVIEVGDHQITILSKKTAALKFGAVGIPHVFGIIYPSNIKTQVGVAIKIDDRPVVMCAKRNSGDPDEVVEKLKVVASPDGKHIATRLGGDNWVIFHLLKKGVPFTTDESTQKAEEVDFERYMDPRAYVLKVLKEGEPNKSIWSSLKDQGYDREIEDAVFSGWPLSKHRRIWAKETLSGKHAAKFKDTLGKKSVEALTISLKEGEFFDRRPPATWKGKREELGGTLEQLQDSVRFLNEAPEHGAEVSKLLMGLATGPQDKFQMSSVRLKYFLTTRDTLSSANEADLTWRSKIDEAIIGRAVSIIMEEELSLDGPEQRDFEVLHHFQGAIGNLGTTKQRLAVQNRILEAYSEPWLGLLMGSVLHGKLGSVSDEWRAAARSKALMPKQYDFYRAEMVLLDLKAPAEDYDVLVENMLAAGKWPDQRLKPKVSLAFRKKFADDCVGEQRFKHAQHHIHYRNWCAASAEALLTANPNLNGTKYCPIIGDKGGYFGAKRLRDLCRPR